LIEEKHGGGELLLGKIQSTTFKAARASQTLWMEREVRGETTNLYRGLIWESMHQIAEKADSSPARVWSPWRTRWRRRKGRGKTLTCGVRLAVREGVGRGRQRRRGEGARPASRLGMGLSLGRGGRMAAGLLGHQADGAEVSSPFFVFFFSFSFLIHFPKPFLNKILNANNFRTKAISIK